MQPEAARAEFHLAAEHTARHFGRLMLWALGCALCVVAIHLAAPRYGARLGSYRSGIATLAGFALAAFYTVRKRWMWLSVRIMRLAMRMPGAVAHRLLLADRLESWRRFHVIIGVVVIAPLWWHMEGGSTGPNRLEAVLAALTALLMLSGLAGAAIQDFLPRAMRIRPGQEVRRDDVDAAIHELYVEAEEAILGRSEALVQTYLKTIRPVLLGHRPRRAMFLATLSGADPAAPVGQRLRPYGASLPGEGQTWEKLVTIAERKVRLEHNDFDLVLSVGWMRIHIGLAIAIGVLITFHIAGVLYFSGL
jgi:hypothetical protein